MNALHIVMYHYVRDLASSRYPRLKGLDEALFRQQIDFFAAHFTTVTMEDVMDAVKTGRPLPERALLLTFDDGYTEHYETVLPVLKAHGMQGSFFIPGQLLEEPVLLDVNKIQLLFACVETQDILRDTRSLMDELRDQPEAYPETVALYDRYAVPNRYDDGDVRFVKQMLQTVLPEQTRKQIIGRLFEKYMDEPEESIARSFYMNCEQVCTMKNDGMFIGVHGYTHGWLANMTEEERREDIAKSLDVLGDVIDRKNWVMNYPYGNCSEKAAQTAESLGACLGLTVEARVADLATDLPMFLPRMDCNDFPPKSNHYREIEAHRK